MSGDELLYIHLLDTFGLLLHQYGLGDLHIMQSGGEVNLSMMLNTTFNLPNLGILSVGRKDKFFP